MSMKNVGISSRFNVQSIPGGGLFFGILNDMRGSLWNQTPYIYEKFIEKKKCMRTNSMLEICRDTLWTQIDDA